MKALDLFPVTIYQTEVRNNDYLKNQMLSEIMEASEHLGVPSGWNTNKLKTSFEGEPEGMEVISKYRSYLETEYEKCCLLYTSPSPRDLSTSRMPSSA